MRAVQAEQYYVNTNDLVKQRPEKICYISVMEPGLLTSKKFVLLQIALYRPIIRTPGLRYCMRKGAGDMM